MKNSALKKLDESIMAKADILGISIAEMIAGSENGIVDKYKNLVYFVEEYCRRSWRPGRDGNNSENNSSSYYDMTEFYIR